MGRLTRKKFKIDREKAQSLAHLLGISEAKAVRRAVDQMLMAEEVTLSIGEIREQGGIDDVFGRADRPREA
jgi:hypothetical protein